MWALVPDFGPNTVGQVALDPEAAKAGLAIAVNKYNKDQALDGNFNTMDPSWAEQHPLEALKIISDYYKNKNKCPTK